MPVAVEVSPVADFPNSAMLHDVHVMPVMMMPVVVVMMMAMMAVADHYTRPRLRCGLCRKAISEAEDRRDEDQEVLFHILI